MNRSLRVLAIAALLAGLACRSGSKQEGPRPFRLGYFPNVTHGQALVGSQDGTFEKALDGTPLKTFKFNAGPSAMEALLAGELDATYVGTGPALNAYVRSEGALKIIAGAATGGALLIAKDAKTAEDLRGKKVASPQLGNTQDIALRHWLAANGLKSSRAGGGDVTVVPIGNADILNLFKRGQIEAAWVPEPWASRLIVEGGGHVLVDEATLWPGGKFTTTVLVASTKALETRREDVKRLLRAHVELTRRALQRPQAFDQAANEAFKKLTNFELSPEVAKQAFSRIHFETEPYPEQILTAARHATEMDFLPETDLSGLVDTSLLEEVKREKPAPRRQARGK